jgi:hypothetical protein
VKGEKCCCKMFVLFGWGGGGDVCSVLGSSSRGEEGEWMEEEEDGRVEGWKSKRMEE